MTARGQKRDIPQSAEAIKVVEQKPSGQFAGRALPPERARDIAKPVIKEIKPVAAAPSTVISSDYEELDNGDLVSKDEFNKLSADDQASLNKLGVKGFNENKQQEIVKAFEEANVKVGINDYVPKEDFNKLSADDQASLKKLGVDEFNKAQQQFIATNYVKLSTDEYIPRADYNKLTLEQQQKLVELGVDKFNKYMQDKVTADYQAQAAAIQSQIIAVTPKAVPLKEGTGKWAGIKGSDFVRTPQGDIPVWMLVPDASLSSVTPGTSYGPAISNVTYPVFNPIQWDYVRYTEEMAGIDSFGIEHKAGDIVYNASLSSPGGAPPLIQYLNKPWTEETYLVHLGITPEQAKKQMFGSHQGVTGIYNRVFDGATKDYWYIDPETGEGKNTKGLVLPYGLLDKNGNLIQPMNPSREPEYVDGRWGAKVTEPAPFVGLTGIVTKWPESVAKAVPEFKPGAGRWPTEVITSANLMAKLSAEELEKQIAQGEIIKAKDNVLIPKSMFNELSRDEQYKFRTEGTKDIFEKTAKGELVKSDFLKTMTEDDRKILMEQGIDAYDAKLAKENELIQGQWIPKDFINALEKQPKGEIDWAKILRDKGYDVYVALMDKVNERISDGKGGWVWYPKAAYAQIEKTEPEMAKILKEQGYSAYISKISDIYEQIPDGKGGFQWMPRESDAKKGIVGINDLPKPQQDILRNDGVEVWKNKVEGWEKSLSAFTIKDGKGEILGYDLISARRFSEGGYDAVSTLPQWFEDKGIRTPSGLYKLPWLEGLDKKEVDEAVTGLYKLDDVEKLTANVVIVPKDMWEKLQIISEETASQKSIEHWSANSFLQSIGVLRGLSFEESKARGEVVQQSLAGMPSDFLPYIVGASVAISTFSEGAHDFLKTGPWWVKPEAGVLLAAGDLLITVPSTILSGFLVSQNLASQAQQAKTKEEYDTLMVASNAAIIGLGAGLIGWMAGRPQAVKQDPWLEGPYSAVMIIGPAKVLGMAKSAGIKLDPRKISNTAIALEADVGRITTPKSEIGLYNPRTGKFDYDVYMSPARARELIAAVQKRIIEQIPDAVLENLRSGKDVVIKMPDGTIVAHLSAFQQSVPGVLWHAHPDMHVKYVNTINAEGRIKVAGEEGEYGGMFMSGKPSALFLARRAPKDPGYVATIVSLNDFRDLPPKVAKLLDAGKLAEAKEMFYGMGRRGELGDYIYPLAKWYNKMPRLEDEMWASPTFNLNKAPKIPWYLREKGVETGINYTTSPIEAKIEGVEIKSGQDIPILWLLSDRAIAEGKTLPTLTQFYKSELLDFVTTARKIMPWNIKLRKWTLSEEVLATDTMLSSKFTGLVLKNKAKSIPEWEWEIHKKPEGGWTRPQEAMIFDDVGRRLRSRVTGIIRDPQGRIMLVWDKVDKAWNLPGGRRDPYGELGRDPKTGLVSTPEGALYGQILHETGVSVSNIKEVGTHRGKVTTHSLYGQDVFVAEAKNPKFDLKKYTKKGEVPELRDAVWWDGKSPTPRGDVYPGVVDILNSAKWVDTSNLKIYKDTPGILLKARDRGFANRYSVDWQGREVPMKPKPIESKAAETLPKLEEAKPITVKPPEVAPKVGEVTFSDNFSKGTRAEVSRIVDSLPSNLKVEIKEFYIDEALTKREGALAIYYPETKAIIFRNEAVARNPSTIAHEIAHHTVDGKVISDYAKIAKPRVEGVRETFAEDFGNYISNPNILSKESQQFFSEHFPKPEVAPKVGEVKPLEAITHRGADPEAIKVGEQYGLSFDGMQEGAIKGEKPVYQFTTQLPEAKGITFYVEKLSEIPARLNEKLAEFGIKPEVVTKTEIPTVKTLDDFVKTDDARIKIQLDAFGDKLWKSTKDGDVTFLREMTPEGKETSRFLMRVQEGKEAYISRPKEFENRKVEGEVELQYGDYVRTGDTGIAFIPKEGGVEYWAGVETEFAKPEVIGKITSDMEADLKTLKYTKEQIGKMTPQEAWEKLTVSRITRNTELKIDEIVSEVQDRAIKRADKGKDYEQAFLDEARKMSDELVADFDRSGKLPYRARLERMRLPLLGESRVKVEQRSDIAIKQFVDDRIKAGETGRKEVMAEARPKARAEIITEPRLEIGVESKLEGGIEPKVESRIEPTTEAVVEPRIETGIEPRIEMGIEPRLEPLVSPRVTPETRMGIEPRVQPTPEPRIEPIPKIIPKPVPVPLRKYTAKYIEEHGVPEGTAAWKQGWCYRHWFPPYDKDSWYFSRKPLPGVPYASGPDSAYDTIVRLGGEIPPKLEFDMGLHKVKIVRGEKGKDPGIHFTLDREEASWSPEKVAERKAEEALQPQETVVKPEIPKFEVPIVATQKPEISQATKIEIPPIKLERDLTPVEKLEKMDIGGGNVEESFKRWDEQLAKPKPVISEVTQIKNIENVPIAKIKTISGQLSLQEAMNNVLDGRMPKAEGNILLNRNPGGTYTVSDGVHKIAQSILNGNDTIKAEIAEEIPIVQIEQPEAPKPLPKVEIGTTQYRPVSETQSKPKPKQPSVTTSSRETLPTMGVIK